MSEGASLQGFPEEDGGAVVLGPRGCRKTASISLLDVPGKPKHWVPQAASQCSASGQARASETPETRPTGESQVQQTPAQVFAGPVPRPLLLDNGVLNGPGKLNSCLPPSEWEARALLTAPQGGC